MDYDAGWYEAPEDEPECPDVWHVVETGVQQCPTCGFEEEL